MAQRALGQVVETFDEQSRALVTSNYSALIKTCLRRVVRESHPNDDAKNVRTDVERETFGPEFMS